MKEESGWCLREIPIFGKDNTSMSDDYYFGSFESPRKYLDHSHCTEIVCSAKNVIESEYVTKHVADDCHCENIMAPSKIMDIIGSEDGGIPILSWRNDELCVVKYDAEAKTKYVAISHVCVTLYRRLTK